MWGWAFVIAFFVLRGVASLVVLGWRLSRFLWAQRTIASDQHQWLFTARNILGIVVLSAAYVIWRPDEIDGWRALNQGLGDRFSSAVPLVVVVVGVAVLLIAAARRGEHRRMVASMMIPIGTVIVTVFGTIALLLVMSWATSGLQHLMRTPAPDAAAGFALIMLNLALTLSLGAALFILLGTVGGFAVHGVGAMFRAHDGHPLMPAFVTSALAVWTVVVSAQRLASDAEWLFPPVVQLSLGFAGPVIVLALSVWQFVRVARTFPLREAAWAPGVSRISDRVDRTLCAIQRGARRSRRG